MTHFAPDLLLSNVSTLIRTYGNDAVSDAATLAARILSPHKAELPPATHKFSVELFIAATLHIVLKDSEATLKDVLECITDPARGTEKEMLNSITISSQCAHRQSEIREAIKKISKKTMYIGNGPALRLVAACNAQWRKAFGLGPMPLGSPFYYMTKPKAAPNPSAAPNPADIRIGTRYELTDATALATKMLSPVQSNTDSATYEFAHKLFAITALTVAHQDRFPTLKDVMVFLSEKNWDSNQQIITYLINCDETTKQKKTAEWKTEWLQNKVLTMTDSTLKSLIKRSDTLWQQAYLEKDTTVSAAMKKTTKAATAPAQNSIQVFNLETIGRALTLMSEVQNDRKGGGDRILESAQANGGYRTIPDAKKAGAILEKAKSEFENLVEPISQLQLNLALSGAMKPENFRVTPILLLGDPGIGKTYLAMALAHSLGGGMEKLSAGGALGGFQLNGSHTSYTGSRCGLIFQALAEGKTTSPVFVIDEVDKIGSDDRHPILPVLLDLFEPLTAMAFKDEFFETTFDASRIIYILTANSIDAVPEPLRSRVSIFKVPRPEPDQRLRIIQNEAKQLREATSTKIKLDKATTQELADRKDIDLRLTVRIVQEAFTKALVAEEKIAKLIIPRNNKDRPMGFH